MRTTKNSPRQAQVIIGEKLKAILLKDNGKNRISFSYCEKEEEHIGLKMAWTSDTYFSASKTFLSLHFPGLLIGEGKMMNTIIVSLHQITHSSIHQEIRFYYDENCNGDKISINHVDEILEELKLNGKTNGNLKEDNEDEKVVEPIEQISALDKKDEKSMVKEKKEPKFLLKSFFSHLLDFEASLEVPILQNLPELFILEVNDRVNHLTCRYDIVASKLETAICWHLKRTYKVAPVVARDGDKVMIDYSLSQKKGKERMITNRAFCLAPIEQTTISDMKKRLHRVYFSAEPIVEKTDGYFCIKYQSNRAEQATKTVHTIISEMGWRSKIDEGNLLVFPGSVSSVVPSEIPAVEPVASIDRSETPALHTSRDDFDLKISPPKTPFVITGTIEEVLAEIKTRYEDKEFYDLLSEETKNKAYFVSEEYRKKNNAEDYMRALLDYVEKNK